MRKYIGTFLAKCRLNDKKPTKMNEEKTIEEILVQSEAQTEDPFAENAAEETQNEEVAQDEAVAEKTVEEKLAEALAEIDSLKDKYLRQVAEFDNFRKRTIKEKTELILNGGQRVMEALLPVLDDMQRAEANLNKATDVEALKEGLDLVFSKFRKTLGAQGLKEMETKDAEFDTDFHEAVALVPAAEGQAKNIVIDCVESGYTLNDKVIRHAKVVVSQ